jgi:hypothetical protein
MTDSTNTSGTALEASPEAPKARPFAAFPDKKQSNAQPLWQLILLNTITFSGYYFYWSYRNWKHLKDYKNLDISPARKTLAQIIPIAGIAFAWELFKGISDFTIEAGAKRSFEPGMMVVGLIVFNVMWRLPDPYYLLGILSVIPPVIVQRSMNSAWAEIEPGLPVRRLPAKGDVLAVIATWAVIVTLGIILSA